MTLRQAKRTVWARYPLAVAWDRIGMIEILSQPLGDHPSPDLVLLSSPHRTETLAWLAAAETTKNQILRETETT
jgi:hypothetical protein